MCSKTTYLDRICVVNISSYNVTDMNLYAVDNVRFVRRMIGAVKKKIVTVVLTLHEAHVTVQIMNQSHLTHKRGTHNEQNAVRY